MGNNAQGAGSLVAHRCMEILYYWKLSCLLEGSNQGWGKIYCKLFTIVNIQYNILLYNK